MRLAPVAFPTQNDKEALCLAQWGKRENRVSRGMQALENRNQKRECDIGNIRPSHLPVRAMRFVRFLTYNCKISHAKHIIFEHLFAWGGVIMHWLPQAHGHRKLNFDSFAHKDQSPIQCSNSILISFHDAFH